MDDGEKAPKRARKNPEVNGGGAGPSPNNTKGGPGTVYLEKSGVGSDQHSESGKETQKHEYLGSLERLLGAEPPLAALLTASASEMVSVARDNAPGLREWLLSRAKSNASCSCPQPRPRWSKNDPKATSTCGDANAGCIANITMEQILKRQSERGGGDDVAYVLARTVRSCIQYNAAEELGCRGRGSQCRRGVCMARAMDMFCGQDMEGIPQEVVRALCRF